MKLLRGSYQSGSTPVMLTASKSVLASQKVDLYSIAGKLKLLSQPPVNTVSCNLVAPTLSRQRLPSSSKSKNSLKFASRKLSVEARDDAMVAKTVGTSAQTCKNQKMRFLSAESLQNEDE